MCTHFKVWRTAIPGELQECTEKDFTNRHVPAYQTFAAIHRRLGETGTISVARPDAGRPRAVRDPDMEDDILDNFHNALTTSTRAATSVFHVSRMTVWRVLHENLQYPFHIQRVQGLNVADYPRRVEFATWFLQQREEDGFPSKVFFTDEATFMLERVFNTHNQHI